MNEKKYLYCTKCKSYPHEIHLIYLIRREILIWNDELKEYETTITDHGEPKYTCSNCNSELINEEETDK